MLGTFENVLDAALLAEFRDGLDRLFWQWLVVKRLALIEHERAIHQDIAVKEALVQELRIEICLWPSRRDERLAACRAQPMERGPRRLRYARLLAHDIDQRAVDVKESCFHHKEKDSNPCIVIYSTLA